MLAINPQAIAIITSWGLWGGLLTQVLWIAAGPLLAGYAWRKRERLARPGHQLPMSCGPASTRLPAFCRARGFLSTRPASCWRGGAVPKQVVGPSLALVTDRGIWLERACLDGDRRRPQPLPGVAGAGAGVDSGSGNPTCGAAFPAFGGSRLSLPRPGACRRHYCRSVEVDNAAPPAERLDRSRLPPQTAPGGYRAGRGVRGPRVRASMSLCRVCGPSGQQSALGQSGVSG